MLKTQTALSNKLDLPYITHNHLTSEQHIYIRLKLVSEVKAMLKRQVITKLFELLAPPYVEVTEVIQTLSMFEGLRNEADSLKKEDLLLEPMTEIPVKLASLGDEWQRYLFHDFDYTTVNEAEYNELCAYLVMAFSRVAEYRGTELIDPKGLDITHFEFDRLPLKLQQSVKNPARYRSLYSDVVAKNQLYAAMTDDSALAIFMNINKFQEFSITFNDYISFYDIADKLTLSMPHVSRSLLTHIRKELFEFGILYIHDTQLKQFVDIFKRYEVIKNNEVNQHAMHASLKFLLEHTKVPAAFNLPPLTIVKKPLSGSQNDSPTSEARPKRLSVNFDLSGRDKIDSSVSPRKITDNLAKVSIVSSAENLSYSVTSQTDKSANTPPDSPPRKASLTPRSSGKP